MTYPARTGRSPQKPTSHYARVASSFIRGLDILLCCHLPWAIANLSSFQEVLLWSWNELKATLRGLTAITVWEAEEKELCDIQNLWPPSTATQILSGFNLPKRTSPDLCFYLTLPWSPQTFSKHHLSRLERVFAFLDVMGSCNFVICSTLHLSWL